MNRRDTDRFRQAGDGPAGPLIGESWTRGLLVTGATGMVGSYVVAEMLARAARRSNFGPGDRVNLFVLARSKGRSTAEQRMESILAKFEAHWGLQLPRPVVLEGDLLAKGLGLSAADRRQVSQCCDRLLHSAANLSFAPASTDPNNEPYRTNVNGTENLIAFCQCVGIESMHHISTAYVCGTRSGTVLESETEVGQQFANDYERSKSIAELMVADAFSARELTAYRPSIVIDREGLAPVSGDRTIYGAYSMYQMLASRFGLPEHGVWFRDLGFAGHERKNLVDVDWVARAVATIVADATLHGVTYHLTSDGGTSIDTLDRAFRISTERWLKQRKVIAPPAYPKRSGHSASAKAEIDQMAEPFVRTFLPYFRDDPHFDRTHIDRVVQRAELDPPPAIQQQELLDMIANWSAVRHPSTPEKTRFTSPKNAAAKPSPRRDAKDNHRGTGNQDDVVICGYAVRLPGGVDSNDQFEDLLFSGRSAIEAMPEERLDRSLYFDPKRGIPGKTYTEVGGCVDPEPLDPQLEQRIAELGDFDLTHRQFAQVAVEAFRSAIGADSLDDLDQIDPTRAGVFVGHSGGTQRGGPLAMATMAQAAACMIEQTKTGESLDASEKQRIIDQMTHLVRQSRPSRGVDGGPNLNAYAVASLAAKLTGVHGRREVIDAACSSSLIALQHAALSIAQGRLDVALVGGATFNNVDNLALFSQSGACSDSDSHPFDSRASGLISSEGYVGVVLMRRSAANQLGRPILAVVQGVGVASDGKGKGLWAPRTEGQQLAMSRAALPQHIPLPVDYLECHATSTQVGDATELVSVTALLDQRSSRNGNSEKRGGQSEKLLIGSVKSNLGHLLEAAGLVGVVKCLIAMKRGEIPPSINFSQPTTLFDWNETPVQVADRVTPWPEGSPSRKQTRSERVAGVNAFGIGGLNAHAVIAQDTPRRRDPAGQHVNPNKPERIAIVGRGLILPGCDTVAAFAELLRSDRTEIGCPPQGRMSLDPKDSSKLLGLGDGPFQVPHFRGGYIKGFQFDAQAYRIPPKLVRHANPAQLMLIDVVRQAFEEFDQHRSGGFDRKCLSVDRERVGVSVGTIFGGQFSNELQIGLRLPELQRHLQAASRAAGINDRRIAQWLPEFRDVVLEQYPALLDETGGFTASTLASAVARIFDLMGGACAIDCGEASGGVAMMSGIQRLWSGEVDLMICGAAHRAMDLVAFDQLHRKQQLAQCGKPQDCPLDGSQIFPGEGVACVLLQRFDDAVAQGRQVLSVIEGVCESWVDDVFAARKLHHQHSQQKNEFSAHQLASQVGHLGGAQGMVRTIAATISHDYQTAIQETAQDGYQVSYQINSTGETTTDRATPKPIRIAKSSRFSANQPSRPQIGSTALEQENVMLSNSSSDLIAVRLEATSAEDLGQALRTLKFTDQDLQPTSSIPGTIVSQFGHAAASDLHQAAIVGSTQQEVLESAARLLSEAFCQGRTAATKRGLSWIRFPSRRTRIAWLFPGQGSQYPAAPPVLASDQGAVDFLRRFDERLGSMKLAPVMPRFHDPDQMLGRDVWWTQLWILAAGSMMADSLRRQGYRPDVVLGHSFGECTAAWAAGVMSLEQSIAFAKHRSDAVVTQAGERGVLLSVRAAPARIDAILQRSDFRYTITIHNAPEQTVIAGPGQVIQSIKSALSAAGVASMIIPVPAAFHTPAMEPARRILAARFTNQALRPPVFGYLSAISNRYLAEPRDILGNLIDQLTHPVYFASAVERLVEDGCGLMIEVGPGDVLTRLAAATTGGDVLCLSADHPNRDYAGQTLLLKLAMEAFSLASQPGCSDRSKSNKLATSNRLKQSGRSGRSNDAPISQATANASFEVIDVTKRKGSTDKRRATATPRDTPVGDLPRPPSQSSQPASPPAALAEQLGNRATATTENSSATASPPGAANSTLATNALADRTATATSGGVLASARAFLFDLVVDLTGYDPDIIEFDIDLEGELGVDSIKKAQLIGEIVQWGNLDVDLQSMQLSDFMTLDDILDLVADSSLNNTELDAASETPGPASSDGRDSKADISASLQQMIIDLVVDQTGYDEDIIDMQADLEGELGIDSIKRAQLLGELETTYQLQSLREQNLRLSDFPTLASIHAYVLDHLQSATPVVTHGADLDDGYRSEGEKKKHVDDQSKSELSGPDGCTTVALAESPPGATPGSGTHRFVLRMRNSPHLPSVPAEPKFHGPALIVGTNPLSRQLADRLRQTGLAVYHIDTANPVADLDRQLDEIWTNRFTPHLFITTPHDTSARWSTDDVQALRARIDRAMGVPYRVCQRWMQHAIDQDLMQQCSLVSVVNAGGDLGFKRATNSKPVSAESGGVAGLTKAMLIEAWMRGYRETPMRVIDTVTECPVERVVDGIFAELAVPSYEQEVAVGASSRLASCARYHPIDASNIENQITDGGVWVVAGGGRGITALTAMELAKRHGLKLHLLGMARAESIDDQTRQAASTDGNALRRQTMTAVQRRGENPVKHWRNYEKALEIDQTLDQCRRMGVSAVYHSVDISDAQQTERVIRKIRETDGPIRGVIQGAGSGQDARFDRKRPDKVRQCLQAKIEGCASLAAATRSDPLEFFIGFGSISGRFGANGHTDYSAANDMLAKMIGNLSEQRPETRCFTFHWHAWGDVGMATKPEAKLALDMIGMDFMPAQEGLQHFLNEVHWGGDQPEVLITDRRYVRKFFPDDWMQCAHTSSPITAPLLDPCENGLDRSEEACRSFKVTLDPTKDLFLSDHRVGDRPTLPMVIAVELMAEAASVSASLAGHPARVVACKNLEAVTPLKCVGEDAFAIEIIADQPDAASDQTKLIDRGGTSWRLVSDLRRRDGRLVQSQRTHFSAQFELDTWQTGSPTIPQRATGLVLPTEDAERVADQSPIEYLSPQAPIYHGPSLQALRSIGFAEASHAGTTHAIAVGTVITPSPAQLGGEHRPLAGWILSPAIADAVLYAGGMLAYRVGQRPSLPIRINHIGFGRVAKPGEPLQVTVQWNRDLPSGGEMSATLVGLNRDRILEISGYHVGWLG